MQLAQGVLKWQRFTLNSCKGTSCIIKSYMKLTSSQNYLWEKQSAIKTKMIAIWVNPNATKVKCDCSPPYVVGYLLFGFPKHPTEILRFAIHSQVERKDRGMQCRNLNRKMKGCRLSVPFSIFLKYKRDSVHNLNYR